LAKGRDDAITFRRNTCVFPDSIFKPSIPSLRAKQSNPEAAFAMHSAAPQQAVIPANAGIQYAAVSHSIIGTSEYWIIRFRG
jgi:hypothetical protein